MFDRKKILNLICSDLNITAEQLNRHFAEYGIEKVQNAIIEICKYDSITSENVISEIDILLSNEKKTEEPLTSQRNIQNDENDCENILTDKSETNNETKDILINKMKQDLESFKLISEKIDILSENVYSLKEDVFSGIKNNSCKSDDNILLKQKIIRVKNLLQNSCFLVPVLCLMFYVLGSTSYYYLDAITYSKFHSYMLTTILPVLIVGIILGILTKPVIEKIFYKNRRNNGEYESANG